MNGEKWRDDAPTGWADSWHSGRDVVAVLRLSAPVAADGAVRRVWVGLDANGHTCAVTDDDHGNCAAWADGGPYWVDLEVSASEYRRQMRRVEANRGRYVVARVEDSGEALRRGLGRYYKFSTARRRARSLTENLGGSWVVVDVLGGEL